VQRARVVGKAVSSHKHPSLEGRRLLLVQPLGIGDRPDAEPLLVVDTLGARVGTVILVTSDGKAARKLLDDPATPVRYTTLGLEDANAGEDSR
jgi:ethanolamine utilization protein EutN